MTGYRLRARHRVQVPRKPRDGATNAEIIALFLACRSPRSLRPGSPVVIKEGENRPRRRWSSRRSDKRPSTRELTRHSSVMGVAVAASAAGEESVRAQGDSYYLQDQIAMRGVAALRSAPLGDVHLVQVADLPWSGLWPGREIHGRARIATAHPLPRERRATHL